MIISVIESIKLTRVGLGSQRLTSRLKLAKGTRFDQVLLPVLYHSEHGRLRQVFEKYMMFFNMHYRCTQQKEENYQWDRRTIGSLNLNLITIRLNNTLKVYRGDAQENVLNIEHIIHRKVCFYN